MTKIRTRFAPSPTGRMHVGNLRTALYAYLIAKHEDGDFILRIEDTDQERYVEGAVDIIYRTMAGTGLLHDEGPDKDGGVGPYVQSERQASGIYLKYAQQLIEQGDAYYCFCGPEELESMKRVVAGKEISIYDKRCLRLSKEEVQRRLDAGEPHVIRFNMPTEGTTTFHDVIYGDITVNNEEMEDLILIKSDGYPTYNFANVVDDHLMGITHVVRGNEYLSSAPKYNRIYEAFGWEIPVYVHCPLITNEEHQLVRKFTQYPFYHYQECNSTNLQSVFKLFTLEIFSHHSRILSHSCCELSCINSILIFFNLLIWKMSSKKIQRTSYCKIHFSTRLFSKMFNVLKTCDSFSKS